MTNRCSKCWHPIEEAKISHNTGCPDHPEAKPTDQFDYDRGFKRGFNDLDDRPQYLTGNKAYDFGWRNGRALIDQLADDAAQSRCFG